MPEKSLPTLAAEFWELVRSYAKQETVGPLTGLARAVGFGIAGSLLVGVGVSLLALGGLRALQTETDGRLDNNLSWAPYLIVLVVCAGIAGLAASRIGKKRRQ